MLPAVVLSAQVSVDGIAQAQAKLSQFDRSLAKTAALAEAAGATIESIGDKIENVRALAAEPITVKLQAEVDDKGFEEFGIKKMIAEDPVTTKLTAEVVGKGFEEGGIKKAIFEDPVTTELKAKVDDVGFEEGAIKKAIFEESVTTELKAKVDFDPGKLSATVGRAAGASSQDMFASSTLTKDMTKLRAWERGHPSFFMGVGAAASPAAGAHDTSDAPGFLASLLAGGIGGSAKNILWGHGSMGGRGYMPWGLRLLTGGGALAGAGSVLGFAGLGAEHFAFTGLGLAGSAAGAAAGAGVIGAGALGQMAVGTGSDIAVLKSTIADTKSLGEKWKAAQQAVKKYGAYSKEAKLAQKELNEEIAELGGTKGVMAELHLAKMGEALNHFWDIKTGRARVQAVNILEQGVGAGKVFTPLVAHAAQANLKIINDELKPLFKWIEGPEGIGIFQNLEHTFKQNLPTAMHAFDQGFEFVAKTVDVASKYTGGFIELLDRLLTKANSPEGFEKWEHMMAGWVHDFHVWFDFFKELGGAVYDLFKLDAHTGDAIIETLTGMIHKVREWEKSTEGKQDIHNIFVVHREEIIAMLKVIPPLVAALVPIYMTIAPPLVMALTEVLRLVANLLKYLDEASPIDRWAIGLGLIAIKLFGIKKAWSTMYDLMSGKSINKIIEGSASSEEKMAAASDQMAGAADAAAAAYDRLAAAIEQVIALLPEMQGASAGQMTLFPASTVTNSGAAVEDVAAGGTAASGLSKLKTSAMGFAGEFGRFVASGLAIYGVVNLMSSVLSHEKGHMRDAGFELGGSLIGGLAGFLVGGPGGAMAGVGLGSLFGEQISHLFESQQEDKSGAGIRRQIAHAKHMSVELQQINNRIKNDEKKVDTARKGSKQAAVGVKDAQEHLTEVVKKYGPISEQAHKAEIELSKAREHNRAASNKLADAERLTKNEEKLRLMKSKEAVINDHETIATLIAKVQHKKEDYEQNENSTKSLEKLTTAERELQEMKVKLQQSFETLKQLAPEQAANFHKIAQQAKGMEGGIKGASGIFKQMAHDSHDSLSKVAASTSENSKMWQGWRGHVKEQTGLAEGDVKRFSEGSIKGMGEVIKEMNTNLGKLGVSKVSFTSHSGTGTKQGHVHRAMGGEVVPGIGTGDKVHLSAMVEPGERIFVLNARASRDREKLAMLNHINNATPRFAKGGEMGGYVYPFGSGITWGRIDQGQDMGGSGPIAAIGEAIVKMGSQPGWPGTGDGLVYQFLNGPRRGQDIYTYENVRRSVGIGSRVKAGQKIADLLPGYPDLETGFSDASGTPLANPEYTHDGIETKYGKEMHTFLEALASGGGKAIFGGSSLPGGMSIPQLKKIMLSGPSGGLRELGQAAIAKVQKAAQQYLNKHAPRGATVGGVNVPLGPIQQMAHAMVNKLWPNQHQWSPFVNVEEQEAGWDTHAQNPESTAYGLAQNLSPSTYPAAGRPGSEAPILVQARAQLDWMMNYIKGRYGNPAGAWAHEQQYNWYKKGGVVGKFGHAEKEFVKGLNEIKHHHAARGTGRINRAGRSLKKLEGISGGSYNKIIEKATEAQLFSEYAQDAASLMSPKEQEIGEYQLLKEGKHVAGFRGLTQRGWLEKQLNSLGVLRNLLIEAHGTIGRPENKVHAMIKEAHDKMKHIIIVIREAEAKRREFEKRLKEVERHAESNVHQLEHEKAQLQHALEVNENKPKVTKAVFDEKVRLREEIAGKTAAITSSNQTGQAGVKDLHGKITTINKALKNYEAQKAGIEAFLPPLEERYENIKAARASFFFGGTYKNHSYQGLKEVDGSTDDLTKVASLGNIPGRFGGEILQVQLALRELEAPPEAQNTQTTGIAEELKSLAENEALEWKKRYLVSQSQLATLAGFPTPGNLLAVPYSGAYATGGVVGATVGENGPEILLTKAGGNVVTNAERRQFLASGSGIPSINFEEVHFHEDGTVKGRGTVNGQSFEFEQAVKRVNRKQTRSALTRTPGGKRIFQP